MTSVNQIDNSKLILVTDLDGTFIHGKESLKNSVYKSISTLSEKILLIYATGRGADSIKPLYIENNLPPPDILIGDHGSQILFGKNLKPIEPLQENIARRWNNATQKIHALLTQQPGLTPQPINPPYRVAYYYEPKLFNPEIIHTIEAEGYDVILSCDKYLDVLPKGVNKGSSLLNVIKYFSLPLNSIICSGDSLNDLSLFTTGLKSIVVSNAESKLIKKTREFSNVYHSTFPGLLGVLDGLQFYKQTEILDYIYECHTIIE